MKLLFATPNAFSLFVLRITLAVVFFPHGAQKAIGLFGGKGFLATLSQFTENGMPWIVALLVICGEFLGALALFAGLLTRFAAFGLMVIMIGAIATVHWQFGFFMNWAGLHDGEGYEFHLLAIGIALALTCAGGGRWSMDRSVAAQLMD